MKLKNGYRWRYGIITLLTGNSLFWKVVQSPWKDTKNHSKVWTPNALPFEKKSFVNKSMIMIYEINSLAPSVPFKIKFIKWFTICNWHHKLFTTLFLGFRNKTWILIWCRWNNKRWCHNWWRVEYVIKVKMSLHLINALN